MSQFSLTDDQLAIQDMAQKFTADEITPHAAKWDEEHIFPRETIVKAAELGFGGIYVSEESGGIGLGRLEAAIIMEAMAYGCPSTSAFISIHNMASWMIDTFGSQAVKDKYLPDLVPMAEDLQLLPDRSRSGFRCGVAQDQSCAGWRSLCRDGFEAVYLRRRCQ